MLELMLPPFVVCLILTGIHAYLGIHVVEREVIFVDLALAQIAALGAVAAVLVGMPLHSTSAYVASLVFTFLGAAIFSMTRLKRGEVPQEAIIGIVYVVSAAAAILVLHHVPAEASHLKEMLVGNILFVSWAQLPKVLVLYGAVAAFHYVYRDRFILISSDPAKAAQRRLSLRWWDFLFYMSFGFVVTSSVELAGVLLVFSMLIMPAVCSMLFTKHFGRRLALGWSLSLGACVLGLYASAALDLPTGAAIVCAFGLVVLGSFAARRLLGGRSA